MRGGPRARSRAPAANDGDGDCGGGARGAVARGFETCQLRTRHWRITDARGRVERVDGASVIGKFPLLRDGGWRDDSQDRYGDVGRGQEMTGCFAYQSCSGCSGSFGGQLRFTPGSIESPTGADFDMTVATRRSRSRSDAFCTSWRPSMGPGLAGGARAQPGPALYRCSYIHRGNRRSRL